MHSQDIMKDIREIFNSRNEFLGAKSPLGLAWVIKWVSDQKVSKLQDLASYISNDQFWTVMTS